MEKNVRVGKNICSGNVLIAFILIFAAAICIIPFWLVFVGSLTSEEEIIAKGYAFWPQKVNFAAYKILLGDARRIIRGYQISIFVTAVGTALSMTVTALAAYPLAQARVRYSRQLNFFVLFTMLFHGGMVPWFIVCRNMLHLTDSVWALIFPYTVNAWYIFLVRNYYKSIPGELLEAARIDGSGEYRTFFRIVLPLAKPVMATICLFISLNYWNDWWLGIMLIDHPDKQPLQLLLRTIVSNVQFFSTNTNAAALASGSIPSEAIKMATCIATIGPIILVYPFVQRYFVKGIMVGAVKG